MRESREGLGPRLVAGLMKEGGWWFWADDISNLQFGYGGTTGARWKDQREEPLLVDRLERVSMCGH